MDIQTAQADLNSRFTYSGDRTGENWSILRDDGPVQGDCEDYSLTLIWLSEGQSLIRFWWALITLKYMVWHCQSPGGVGHVIMWVRGHGWTDNIQRKIITKQQRKAKGYRLWFPYVAPLVLFKFIARPLTWLVARIRS
jgi:hypothetical protein